MNNIATVMLEIIMWRKSGSIYTSNVLIGGMLRNTLQSLIILFVFLKWLIKCNAESHTCLMTYYLIHNQ